MSTTNATNIFSSYLEIDITRYDNRTMERAFSSEPMHPRTPRAICMVVGIDCHERQGAHLGPRGEDRPSPAAGDSPSFLH